jgi:hypothetical protein
MPDLEPSAFALAFAQRRFEEALVALAKLSPSLSAHVKSAAGSGPVPERLRRASKELQRLAGGSGFQGPLAAELRSSLGPEYDPKAVSTLLLAHVSGLRSLSTLEGLGAAILGNYASLFLDDLERQMKKLDREARDAAARSVRFRIRSIMTEFDPDEPDNPLALLASMKDEPEASAFVSILIADTPDPNASAKTNDVIFSLSSRPAKSWEENLRDIRGDFTGPPLELLLGHLRTLRKADPEHFQAVLEMVIRLPSAKIAAAYAKERIAMNGKGASKK